MKIFSSESLIINEREADGRRAEAKAPLLKFKSRTPR